jgi:hypothetical protein
MPDRQFWTFINSFAPWASALASSAAVVTALYLARRGDRIRLRVRCGIRVIIQQGAQAGPRPEYVNLEVTNVGRRTATIQTLFWTARFFRKKKMIWIAPQNAYSKPIPVTLADGETANWMAPLKEFDENFADVARDDVGTCLGALSVRAGVLTTTGVGFSARIEQRLRRHFRELSRKTSA